MATNDSSARKLRSNPAGGGIHLVYSRDWVRNPPRNRPRTWPAEPAPTAPVREIPRRLRESRRIATFTLGVAAATGPAVWVGHALLRWLHLL